MGNVYAVVIAAVCVLNGAQAQALCAPDSVELRGQGGLQRFGVEIADTEAERERGLMQRDKMSASAGMLFVYEKPTHAYFWMKDTLLPLDMVFADATGRVTKVHSNAIPQDLTPIDGGEGVSFVLEINAGLAKRLGIVAGTEMRAAAIKQSDAIWPCSDD